jgi:hypothetical protein
MPAFLRASGLMFKIAHDSNDEAGLEQRLASAEAQQTKV